MALPISIKEVKRVVFMLAIWQLAMGVFIGLIALLLLDATTALAGFFGSFIGFTGSMSFAVIVFGMGKITPENTMRKMFRAEAIKIMIIGIMFYIAFAVLALPFLPVILGFMATLITFFVALLTAFK